MYEEHPLLFDDVMVYPPNVFYPVEDNDIKYRTLNMSRSKYQRTFAVHRWHHLWLKPTQGGTSFSVKLRIYI